MLGSSKLLNSFKQKIKHAGEQRNERIRAELTGRFSLDCDSSTLPDGGATLLHTPTPARTQIPTTENCSVLSS